MTDAINDDRFDGLYLNVAQNARGIEPLLDTMFSFLRRKTDFFSGPTGSEDGTAAAVKKVNEVLAKHIKIYNEDQAKKQKKELEKKKVKCEKKVVPKHEKEEDVIELGQDGEFDVSESASSSSSPEKPAEFNVEQSASNNENVKTSDASVEDEEGNTPPPKGNGGYVPGKYEWTQTLQEVNVMMPLPNNTRARDLNVVISKNRLKIALHKDVKVDAKLCKTIIMDDSFWTLEDGNKLCINLQKLNQMEWWDCVCEGDPKIDTKKVQPEESKLGDLDGETRQTVVSVFYWMNYVLFHLR